VDHPWRTSPLGCREGPPAATPAAATRHVVIHFEYERD
jgi:hypothetical protein